MHIELKEGKRYYSIGEVSKAFNVNTSLIRFWDKEFDILKPKKNAKGNRMFTPEDVKNLQLIYHLVKERGFTLDGASRDTDVEFVVTGGRVTLVPQPARDNDRGSKAVARLRGSASTGMSTDEILALTRG